MATAGTIGGSGWTRLHEIGRGASGARVFLAADNASGELFVVKSDHGDNAALGRECGVMSGLSSSPYVLRCFGFQTDGARGEHQMFLEFATGGSLADTVRRSKGCGLQGSAVRAYASDVLRGLSCKT